MEAASQRWSRERTGVQLAVLLLLAGLSALSVNAQEQEMVPIKPSDMRPLLDNPLAGWGTDYTNWVEVSVGNFFVSGSQAAFQQQQQLPDGLFGGIEWLHLEQPVGTNGALLLLDGRGIFDNHDYDLRLEYRVPDWGYIQAGYNQFRTWYDRHGGFYPPTSLWVEPFDREVALDRGEAWLELGLRRPNVPEVTFRYAHDFRSGTKDSTSWGDLNTTAAGNPRSLVPSFTGIDETRDIFALDARHTISATELGAGVRYELIDQDNTLFLLRQPGQATERFVTQKEEVDTDYFNAHASVATRISERALFTAGYAFNLLETDIGGSRIYGSGFEAVFDPTFRRQLFDEGFLNLDGSGHLHEHLFTANFLFTPWENVSILPSLRVSQQDESADSSFIATTLNPPAPGTPSADPTVGSNDRDYTDVAESLELRYTGLTNWLFYARGEWSEDNGDLFQLERDTVTGDEDRLDEDEDRLTQKYIVGATWYPLRRLNLAAQYYHKIRNYDFENRLGPPPTTYPGFIQKQDFDMDDANFRISLRPLNSLSLVTRYDYQLSTIDTAGDSLGKLQSGRIVSHIIGESAGWSPVPRLYLSGNFNYVLDSTHTPANDLSGAAAGLVLAAQNNYWNASALAGYALNDKTDLQLQYFYYRADDFADNSAKSLPYGSGAEENGVTATLIRQLTRSLRWTLKYGYFTNHDQLYGGHRDYNAHMVYSSLQYRF